MTRILIRAARATVAWLNVPVRQERGSQSVPLCIEAWLIRPTARADFRKSQAIPSDRDYPPRRRTIPQTHAWMVRPC